MKFNLSVFDIYSKTMVVESAVVDFKGLVAILGHLGGIRDITVTDNYSFLKSSNGVSITSRKAGGPAYRFDISLVKDENPLEKIAPYIQPLHTFGRSIPYELTVFDETRNVYMIKEEIVTDDVVTFALRSFLDFDMGEVNKFMTKVNEKSWTLKSTESRCPSEKPFVIGVERKD